MHVSTGGWQKNYLQLSVEAVIMTVFYRGYFNSLSMFTKNTLKAI